MFKKNILLSALVVAATSLLSIDASACIGGNVPLASNTVLYGSSLKCEGKIVDSLTVEDTFTCDNFEVTVNAIDSDAGGTKSTTYVIVTPQTDQAKPGRLIKVKTNYLGNGHRTRGLTIPPKNLEVYGCDGREP
jgi:hypothetical protein